VQAVPMRWLASRATTTSCTACVPRPPSTNSNLTSSSPWSWPLVSLTESFMFGLNRSTSLLLRRCCGRCRLLLTHRRRHHPHRPLGDFLCLADDHVISV